MPTVQPSSQMQALEGPSSLPRYWVSRAGAAGVPPLNASVEAEHVVDSFRAGSGPAADREWVVVAGHDGRLAAVPDEQRNTLPGRAQEELTRYELGGGRRHRRIDAGELFLFNLQLLEQPANSPGLDDPVYLYGTLFGPLPTAGEGTVRGVEGQLTVTRADLLDGLYHGAQYAFDYPCPGAVGSRQRCFHLLLPADTEPEIHRGRGLVLAYPLLPPDLPFTDPGNEMLVEQLLYDVLVSLRDDMGRENVLHPLRGRTLPVPSRYMLEQQLAVEGYEIRGNTAVRKAPRGEGFGGFLGTVFGALMSERLDLPPEGSADDFLRLAWEALNGLRNFPGPRTIAVQKRVMDAPAAFLRGGSGPFVPPPPTTAPRPEPVIQPPPPKRPILANQMQPADWMQDFISAHEQPGRPKSRLTSTEPGHPHRNAPRPAAPPARPQSKPQGKPQGKPAARPQPKSGREPAAKPDWMKDFE